MKPPSPTRPHLIIMVGIPGAGKTTFAERFATTFHAPFVSVEQIQKKLFGNQKDQAYHDIALATADLLLGEVLKAHQTVVYDGPTSDPTRRQELVKIAKAADYLPMFVWTQTESAEAEKRTIKRRTMTREDFHTAIDAFVPPTVKEAAIVISGKHAYVSQLKIVLKNLAGTRENQKSASHARQKPHRNIVVR